MTVHVLPDERALLLETSDPSILPRLPAAFQLQPGLLGMPHDLDSVIRLASMGVKAPSPIENYYDWPRERTLVPDPFAHQRETAGFMLSHPHGYVLNDIGTGKTLASLWAADYLMSLRPRVHPLRCCVIAPLSTLERVWGDALFIHLKHRKFEILHGSSERRRKRLANPADFYVINHDGVQVLAKELLARPDIDIWIIDELTFYRNKQTGAWKVLESILYPTRGLPKTWVWGMTGKPIPQSPENAYGQCKLVTPASVPKFFTQWRNLVMDHQSTYIWTPRPESVSIVHKAMQPAIRFKRDECMDLPPEIHTTLDVTLSAEQTKHYKAVMKELSTEVAGGRINAVNEGVKLSKLLQIACGTVYDVNGVPREMDAGNRIETLMELIECVDEKVIVFVPFTAVTASIARVLNKYWNFAIVTGQTPIKERNEIFGRFQQPDSDVDIIAHPECMSHGLTLTEASTIIWFAPIDSNETYEQANGRITRSGQKYTANIIHLAGSAVERRAYRRLRERQKLQGMLLEMYESGEL